MIYEPFTPELAHRGDLMQLLFDAHNWQYFIHQERIRLAREERPDVNDYWAGQAEESFHEINRIQVMMKRAGAPPCKHDYQPNNVGDYRCTKCKRHSILAGVPAMRRANGL